MIFNIINKFLTVRSCASYWILHYKKMFQENGAWKDKMIKEAKCPQK